MSRHRGKSQRPGDEVRPTPERFTQGLVERVPQAIADEVGRPARPYRAPDTLSVMLRKSTITSAMYQAGEDFHALFVTAALNPLRAADLLRLPDGAREMPMSLRQAEARKSVWRALKTLGGMSAPAGSCVWHVVGCEWTLKNWAQREGWNGRSLSQEAASGILIGSLGVLQAHFGL
jgi:hypothetical protein